MSDAVTCDNCGTVLEVNSRGDDVAGEISAWLTVGTRDRRLSQDACTRTCAIALLADDSPLTVAIDERLEVISDIARAVREARDDTAP